MKNLQQGMLINKAGKGRYLNPDAPEKLIKYVTRMDGKHKGGLVAWGGLGITEYQDIDAIIGQFYLVQKTHTRGGNFGRYADHEIYSFSQEEEYAIHKNRVDIDKVAREMAYDFYRNDHCQVVYGVHAPDKKGKHTHIHFVVNTVNFQTGGKRRESMRQTKKRGLRFQKIVLDEINSLDR